VRDDTIEHRLDAIAARNHSERLDMSSLSPADEAQLKAQLQDAVVACTERCLYHSAKWCVDVLRSWLCVEC
jgi:hypothetical protein